MAEPFMLRQWVAVIDGRTTLICLETHGQIVAPGEPFDTHNGKFDNPPAHVHCRAMATPFTSGQTKVKRDRANRELQARPQKYRDIRKVAQPPPAMETETGRAPKMATKAAQKIVDAGTVPTASSGRQAGVAATAYAAGKVAEDGEKKDDEGS